MYIMFLRLRENVLNLKSNKAGRVSQAVRCRSLYDAPPSSMVVEDSSHLLGRNLLAPEVATIESLVSCEISITAKERKKLPRPAH